MAAKRDVPGDVVIQASEEAAASSEVGYTESTGELAAQVSALTRLHGLARELAKPLELSDALQVILDTIVSLHDAKYGLVSLFDPTSGFLNTAASLGFDAEALQRLEGLVSDPPASACGLAFVSKKRVVIQDTVLDPLFESLREFSSIAGFRAVHSTPILTRTGEVLGVLSVHFEVSRQPTRVEIQAADICARQAADVIEAARSREALKESERRYRQFVEALPVAIYSTDAEGQVDFYNEAAVALWGREPEPGKDRWCGSPRMLQPDGRPLPLDEYPMAQAIKEGRSLAGIEAVVERPDGSRRYILAHPRLVRDSSGEVVEAINALVDITDRKRVEARLRESENKLRSIVSLMPAGVYTCDIAGRFTFYNRRAVELWGCEPRLNDAKETYSASCKAYLPDGTFVPPDKTPTAIAIRTGQSFRNFEKVIERPDGTKFSALVNVDPLYDRLGRRIGAINVFHDVSNLKQIEQELAESRNAERARRTELEVLMQAAPAAIWMAHDPECRRITGNPAAYTMLRMRAPENIWDPAPGSTDFEVFRHGHRVEPDEMPLRVAARTGTPVANQELEFRFPDGSSTWAYGNATPLQDERGAVRGAISTFVEITQHKLAEQQIQESERRFRNMADHAPVMVRVTDRNGSCAYLNRSWHEFTGQTVESGLDDGWTAAVHPDDRGDVARALLLATGAREAFRREYRLLRADGTSRWVIDAAAPRFSDGGEFLGFVGSIIDITERKEIEEATAQANADLQEFAYTAAHDLQEPLRNVVISSEMLAKRSAGSIEGDSARFLRYTLDGAKRMQALLTNLLAYTRLNGSEEGDPQMIDSGAVMRKVIEILEASIRENRASIDIGELPVVLAHESRLTQLFQNLLSNAIKYRRPLEAPRITVKAHRQRAEWRFSVSDNGVGIDPEYHQQIFGIFKRLHGNTAAGTGIGLAICHRIVEQYGGRIWVESRGDGHGTTFRFTLPFKESPDARPQ